ncbi:MAG TPA: Gfo/Idh/MocA family oxidoreductase [Pirellulales bacterium]|nr:Gfo/Idh/MocA family oxidoreductase [Pirellulales bacterium]
MTNTPLKLGLLGTGAAVQKLHLPPLTELHGEIKLAGVWSQSFENARAFAAEHSVDRCYADYRELLADPGIEAVLVAVPIERNAAFLIEAVEAGKHVLAEKPIAASVAEARHVLDASERSDRLVAIAENFRYRDDIAQARRIIESGAIGSVQCFQGTSVFDLLKEVRRVYMEKAWRREPRHPGGLVVDAGVHTVAGLREILGEIEEVYAQLMSDSPVTSGPDGLVMQLKLASGAPGHYLTCYTAQTDREAGFELIAYGSLGTLWLTEGKVEWTGQDGVRSSWSAESHDRGYRVQWRNFLAAVRGHESVYSTPEKGFGDLLVLEAALHSARTRQRVVVDEYMRTVFVNGGTAENQCES